MMYIAHMHFTYGEDTVDELDSSRKKEFSRMNLLLYKCKKHIQTLILTSDQNS